MSIDIITVWPRSHDYPLFRSFLANHTEFFNKVIIPLTGVSTVNYEPFLRVALPANTLCIDGDNGQGNDWRDIAVNNALKLSNSEWILFLEQDFFIKDDSFLKFMMIASSSYPAIGFWEANRLHPACLLIRRDLLEKTRKDFSVDHNRQLDHFGMFAEDIVAQAGAENIKTLQELSLEMGRDWYHMQGITHNYNLCRDSNLDPVFKRNEFLTYNDYSVRCKVQQHPEFVAFMRDCAAKLGEYEADEKLKVFFEPLL